MEKKTLNVVVREERKKRAAGRLKRAGKIPAILYGQHGEPKALTVDAREFHQKFARVSENTLIKLMTGAADYEVLVKDYQSNILTGKITHIDFYEVEKDKLLKTRVPIHLEGTSMGVREGGLLEQILHEVEVECLPKDMPDIYKVSIEELKIGEAIHVSDLPPLTGVRVLNQPSQVVVHVTHHKVVVEAAAPVEAAEGEEAAEGAEKPAAAEETPKKEG